MKYFFQLVRLTYKISSFFSITQWFNYFSWNIRISRILFMLHYSFKCQFWLLHWFLSMKTLIFVYLRIFFFPFWLLSFFNLRNKMKPLVHLLSFIAEKIFIWKLGVFLKLLDWLFLRLACSNTTLSLWHIDNMRVQKKVLRFLVCSNSFRIVYETILFFLLRLLLQLHFFLLLIELLFCWLFYKPISFPPNIIISCHPFMPKIAMSYK